LEGSEIVGLVQILIVSAWEVQSGMSTIGIQSKFDFA